ncbi:sigma-70 family RNA polymerase sigma factor [Aureispira anguillae]|uniref:RNA polymerase sigma factor n=1 Tax=Aureispira anguillae TaxID=2864201 RepID=A0A916DP58_9BACT|nr:sigma-70 family RNA polymerase sigma factor [Aureispira anguillae]BDS09966.1 sigma-70 family RNA polymerase sigma factor [Aureispira anguillae]
MENPISKEINVADWVNAYGDELYRYAYSKTGDSHVSEDLVQDAFLGALQNTTDQSEIKNQKSWLFSILRNKVVDYYRELERKSKKENNWDTNLELDVHFTSMGMWRTSEKAMVWNNTENLATNKEFNAILDACLTKLPKHYQAVVRLKIMEDERTDCICEDLGISTSNLWQIIHRTKLRLRKCINKHWFQA